MLFLGLIKFNLHFIMQTVITAKSVNSIGAKHLRNALVTSINFKVINSTVTVNDLKIFLPVQNEWWLKRKSAQRRTTTCFAMFVDRLSKLRTFTQKSWIKNKWFYQKIAILSQTMDGFYNDSKGSMKCHCTKSWAKFSYLIEETCYCPYHTHDVR